MLGLSSSPRIVLQSRIVRVRVYSGLVRINNFLMLRKRMHPMTVIQQRVAQGARWFYGNERLDAGD